MNTLTMGLLRGLMQKYCFTKFAIKAIQLIMNKKHNLPIFALLKSDILISY